MASTVGDTLGKILPGKYGEGAKSIGDMVSKGTEAASGIASGVSKVLGFFGKDMMEMDRTPFYD